MTGESLFNTEYMEGIHLDGNIISSNLEILNLKWLQKTYSEMKIGRE